MIADNNDKKVDILDEALNRFFDAYVHGKQPDIDKFVESYPLHEVEIRQRVRSLYKIDSLFDSIVQTDASDFEEGAERDLVGKRIGCFEIMKVIGRGGMGVVYLANDTKLKRSVALKSIPAKLAADPKAKMRFRSEAELLASLNHPNIAVIHDIIEDETKTSYLVLEYIEGQTLSMQIAQEPLTVEQALSIGKQIAEAVSAAHKKGIVHRDLKPGNIKITPDGLVKVLDFGLAKPFTVDAANTQAKATQRHHIIGTPAYMSPEQARGQPTDHRTDIWSFGCIMYQMLTGHLAFEGETATDTLAHIIDREPDWKLLPKEIPENLRILLRRCLEKDPDKRLEDMTDIILQISDTLSKPLTAPVPAISPNLKRIAMFVGTIVIITLAAVGVWFAIQPPSSDIWLAVLPFENVGPTDENLNFADAITDEITTRLDYIPRFNVFSREAAIEFKKMGIQNAIDSYGIDYYIEGTVLCEPTSDPNRQVKISASLYNAADFTRVWHETYDDRNMSDIFALQFDIAEKVARALDIKLLEPERKALAYGYTDNTEAYLCFLEGKQNFNLGTKKGVEEAIKMYFEAIELEPEYAQAYASLTSALMQMYWWYGKNPELLNMAESAANSAITLDPNLPGAHVALGRYYYQGCFEYENALKEFATALRSHPNHVWATAWTAYAKRRQGKFEEALVDLLRASELDPVSSILLYEIAFSYRSLGRYEKAEDYFQQAIKLDPNKPMYYNELAWTYLVWKEDTIKAREVLDNTLNNKREGVSGDLIYNTLALIDIYDGEYKQAIEKLDSKPGDFENMAQFIPESLLKAEIYGYMAKEALEQQDYQTAEDYENEKQKHYKSALEILANKVDENPGDDRYRSSLGKAYAGLGPEYKEDAIKYGNEAVRCAEKDAIQKRRRYQDLARIYVMVGEYDQAIDIIQDLSLPGPMLRLDPVWKPLLDHPRFKKLVEE